MAHGFVAEQLRGQAVRLAESVETLRAGSGGTWQPRHGGASRLQALKSNRRFRRVAAATEPLALVRAGCKGKAGGGGCVGQRPEGERKSRRGAAIFHRSAARRRRNTGKPTNGMLGEFEPRGLYAFPGKLWKTPKPHEGYVQLAHASRRVERVGLARVRGRSARSLTL
jgi:hypothetical protein